MWQWIIAWLVWLSADPAAIDLERPRCAAAVSAARASLVVDAPTPAPKPDGECCGECGGSGYIVMPDGHRVACPCPPDCECKTASVIVVPGGCTDGNCATPGASPATDSPATTASGR